jgi:tungstate transport system substrate-binding protein
VRLLVVAAAVLIGGTCDEATAPPMRLATTTSVNDSGLLDALLPVFRDRTDIQVGVVAVGTGLALKLAERGEADAVITHDKEREEAFIASGHALERRVFARSDFVIVGPADDPAGIRGLGAPEAFARVAESHALFASRGDSSGTHARELWLWKEARRSHSDVDYVEVRAGMQTTLQFADERKAYTLSDRATYLAHRGRLDLVIVVEGDPLLANDYAVMVIDTEKHPEADRRRAQRFADWLFSDEARAIIVGLERGGERLFQVPDASNF